MRKAAAASQQRRSNSNSSSRRASAIRENRPNRVRRRISLMAQQRSLTAPRLKGVANQCTRNSCSSRMSNCSHMPHWLRTPLASPRPPHRQSATQMVPLQTAEIGHALLRPPIRRPQRAVPTDFPTKPPPPPPRLSSPTSTGIATGVSTTEAAAVAAAAMLKPPLAIRNRSVKRVLLAAMRPLFRHDPVCFVIFKGNTVQRLSYLQSVVCDRSGIRAAQQQTQCIELRTQLSFAGPARPSRNQMYTHGRQTVAVHQLKHVSSVPRAKRTRIPLSSRGRTARRTAPPRARGKFWGAASVASRCVALFLGHGRRFESRRIPIPERRSR